MNILLEIVEHSKFNALFTICLKLHNRYLKRQSHILYTIIILAYNF